VIVARFGTTERMRPTPGPTARSSQQLDMGSLVLGRATDKGMLKLEGIEHSWVDYTGMTELE